MIDTRRSRRDLWVRGTAKPSPVFIGARCVAHDWSTTLHRRVAAEVRFHRSWTGSRSGTYYGFM